MCGSCGGGEAAYRSHRQRRTVKSIILGSRTDPFVVCIFRAKTGYAVPSTGYEHIEAVDGQTNTQRLFTRERGLVSRLFWGEKARRTFPCY